LRAWIICFGLISAVGVVQFFTGLPRAQPNPLLPGYFHPVLFLGHHLSVASIWIFPFFCALELLVNREFRARVGLRLWFLVPAVVCAAFVLVFAYSRTLWVALPVGLVVWSLLRLPRRVVVGLTAALLVCGAVFSQLPVIQTRLHTEMGVGDRIELWKANWAFFVARPLFGVGFGKNQGLSYDYFRSIHPGQTDFFVGHAHNIYLELLAGTGLAGLLAWLAWIGGVFAALLRAIRAPGTLSFAGAAFAAWVVFLVNGATQVNFWEGKVLHQCMWMAGMGLLWATRSSNQSLDKL
jgi:O-antigen ligase